MFSGNDQRGEGIGSPGVAIMIARPSPPPPKFRQVMPPMASACYSRAMPHRPPGPRLPLDVVLDLPAVMRLGPSETGALCALALHHWRSGCAPLPTSSVALQRLSKAHPSAWYRYNKRVLSTLPGVLEAVEVLYRKMAPAYHARAQHLRRVRPSGSTAKAAKSPEAQRPPIMTEPGTVQGPLWPTRAPVVAAPRTIDGRLIPARVTRPGHAPPLLTE